MKRAAQIKAFVHSSAALTELHVMRAFVKLHDLVMYVDAFRFIFINVSLNKVPHNLYSNHIQDLFLPFSESSEQMYSVRGKGGQDLMCPPLYIEIKSRKHSIFHLLLYYLISKFHVHEKCKEFLISFRIFLPLFLQASVSFTLYVLCQLWRGISYTEELQLEEPGSIKCLFPKRIMFTFVDK